MHNVISSGRPSLLSPAPASATLFVLSQRMSGLRFVSLGATASYLRNLKITKALDSVIVGAIFAGCFAIVTFFGELRLSVPLFAAKLAVLILVFSLYSTRVSRIKNAIGICTVFITALWLPLEYVMLGYIGEGAVIDFSACGSTMNMRFGSLFGLLMIFFLVILTGSVFVRLFEYAGKIDIAVSGSRLPCPQMRLSGSENIKPIRRWRHHPALRAPPFVGRI